jgi:hypothetical protein
MHSVVSRSLHHQSERGAKLTTAKNPYEPEIYPGLNRFYFCQREIAMTDHEIHELIARCRSKGSVSWDVLASRFSQCLVTLSGRLTEEELYSLMDIAIACYQKGYDEFAAGMEAERFISNVKRRSRHSHR